MTRFALPLMLAIGLALASCGGKRDDAGADGLKVTTMIVQPSTEPRIVSVIGTTRYTSEVPVGFSEAGTVASLRVREGDHVREGAVLASLSVTMSGSGDSVGASADLEKARTRFAKIQDLKAQGLATNKQFAESEAAVMRAEAVLDGTRNSAGSSGVYAPVAGTVIARLVQQGQGVSAGTAAFIIGEDAKGFDFRVPVSGPDATKLRKGMTATISLPSLGEKGIEATIAEIEGSAAGAGATVTALLHIPAQPGLAGAQIGNASISIPPTAGGAFHVPETALTSATDKEAVIYIVDRKTRRVEARSVLFERDSNGTVTVLTGLKPGDMIVTASPKPLRAGQKVKPSTP